MVLCWPYVRPLHCSLDETSASSVFGPRVLVKHSIHAFCAALCIFVFVCSDLMF